MSFIPFILQGAFFGYVLGNFLSMETDLLAFIGLCLINAALVIVYGDHRRNE